MNYFTPLVCVEWACYTHSNELIVRNEWLESWNENWNKMGSAWIEFIGGD